MKVSVGNVGSVDASESVEREVSAVDPSSGEREVSAVFEVSNVSVGLLKLWAVVESELTKELLLLFTFWVAEFLEGR